MSNDSAVQIKIPEDLVRGIIQGEIIKQMGDQEAMIRAVVQAAMDKKVDSYSRETMFQAEFRNQINEMAKAMFGEWIKQNTEKIRKAVHDGLTKGSGKRIREIADTMVAKMGVSSHVSFEVELERADAP